MGALRYVCSLLSKGGRPLQYRFVILLSLLGLAPACVAQSKHLFEDPSIPLESRINNVLSLLTLDEKMEGLGNKGVVSARLGIPGVGFGEALSGVVYGAHFSDIAALFPGAGPKPVTLGTTQFPQGVGLGRTWDPDLVQRAGAVIGSEARWIYENGKSPSPNLVLFTPNADLARDPRWGRTQETYGEDPFLAGTLAAAMVKGVQGDDPHYWQAASLVKHFFANSNEDKRFSSSAVFDERLMREYYAAPFEKAFVEGGARCFMASYNAWNGVPMSVNPLLRSLAQNEWGVDGIISSDAGALGNLVSEHKTSADLETAVVATIRAGLTAYLTVGEQVKPAVLAALEHKSLTEADLDDALRGNLRVAFRLGLFDGDRPTFHSLKGVPDPSLTDEHKAVARQVSRESIVLLKNANAFLPLDKSRLKSVAVIGPLANMVPSDMYSGVPPYIRTPLAALKARLEPETKVTYVDGNSLSDTLQAAKSADLVIAVIGNDPICHNTPQEVLTTLMGKKSCANPAEGMEGSDRKSIDLRQEALVKQVYATNSNSGGSGGQFAIRHQLDPAECACHSSYVAQRAGGRQCAGGHPVRRLQSIGAAGSNVANFA